MEQLPDPTAVQSWPQAVVYVALILCVIALPAWLSHLGNRRIKRVEDTLTTNNGGSHLKDQLDRIESGLGSLTGRVSALEADQQGVLRSLFRRL